MLRQKNGLILFTTIAALMTACADGNDTKPYCGDKICNNGETTLTCPDDCDKGPGENCGNGACDAGETMTSCPTDCGNIDTSCGNGTCDSNETTLTCPLDCQAVCGDDRCDQGENEDLCAVDCHVGTCGDNHCDANENGTSCPADCKVAPCGNGKCEPAIGETYLTCSADCEKEVFETCGDGSCSENEQKLETCPQDCPVDDPCGDGICDAENGESDQSCPDDCADTKCGDNNCVIGETPATCPNDCKALDETQYNDLTERPYRVFYDLDIAYPVNDADVVSGKKTLSNEDFFRYAYPSDLRTDADGRMSLLGLTFPGLAENLKLIKEMKKYIETERPGFSPLGAIYFRLTHDISDFTRFPTPDQSRQENSCFQLINVEKSSSHYGERVPVYVTFHKESNVLWAQNTLVMRPVPGLQMHPGDKHVAIVQNCLATKGHKIEQSTKLTQILKQTAPNSITKHTNEYVDALVDLNYDLSKIVAFTGFDTMDIVGEMMTIANHLKGKGSFITDQNGTAKGTYTKKSSYGYFFEGSFKTLNYMEGTRPYKTLGSGEIVMTPDFQLVNGAQYEEVRFGISIPSAGMPKDGYPIIVYGHGTGGDFESHCTTLAPGYTSEGNWLLYKGVNAAMIGFDGVLHGKRGDFTSDMDMYLTFFQNPLAIRESWRQTVIDMLVLYDLIGDGKLKLPNPKGSGDPITFDPSYGMYMGHSQGSQEAGLLLGLSGQIKNAFLSAGGAGIIQAFMDLVVTLELSGFHLGPMTVADLIGTYFLGVKSGELSIDTFIANQFVQPLLDPIEPLNFTHRFIKEPPEGWPSKNIAQTIGLRDESTPNQAQFAMATAIGLPTVGKMFVTSDHMKLAGLDKPQASPAANNVKSADGKQTVTGGVMQFDYDGSSNPHFVIYRMKDARDTYPAFFSSVIAGTPTVTVVGGQTGHNNYE